MSKQLINQPIDGLFTCVVVTPLGFFRPWRVSSGLLLEEECQKFAGGGFLPAELQH